MELNEDANRTNTFKIQRTCKKIPSDKNQGNKKFEDKLKNTLAYSQLKKTLGKNNI